MTNPIEKLFKLIEKDYLCTHNSIENAIHMYLKNNKINKLLISFNNENDHCSVLSINYNQNILIGCFDSRIFDINAIKKSIYKLIFNTYHFNTLEKISKILKHKINYMIKDIEIVNNKLIIYAIYNEIDKIEISDYNYENYQMAIHYAKATNCY